MRCLLVILIALLFTTDGFSGQVVRGSGGVGGSSGVLLLGTNSLVTSADGFTGNPGLHYPMKMAATISGTVKTACVYDAIGYETDPAHFCIWTTTGTMLGCSPSIPMRASPGESCVGWAGGPVLTQGTEYVYAINVGGAAGFWTNYDASSPAQPMMDSTPAVTFGSEGNITPGTFNSSGGSLTIYVTN